jgi:hypothetical protein
VTSRLLFVVWVVSASLMYWMMSHGPGITPDAIVYLEAARSVLAGQGLGVAGVPMTHFPPVYPLLLAAIGLVDHDLLHAARLLNAFLFGANIVLVSSAVYIATGRRIVPATCAALLFVVSAPALDLHAMAWSEPLFFAFTLSGLLVLAARVTFLSRRTLVLGATCLGLAMATRYVGIMLIPVLLLVLWFMGSRPFYDRMRETLVAVPLVVAPLGLWMVRNAMISHGVTDRTLAWHPVGRAQLEQSVQTLSDGILPLPVGVFAKLALLLGLLLLLAAIWRPSPAEENTDWYTGLAHSLPSILALFVVMYVAFLLVSISLADAGTPLDDRLLFPVFGCAIVAATIIGARFAWSRPWARWGLSALVLLSLGLRLVPAVQTVIRVYRDGSGYSSEGWRGSPAIAQLGALPRTVVVFSNASEAVGYLTPLRVLPLPDSLSPATLLPNPRFQAEITTICVRVNSGGAVAVYLTTEGIGDPDEKARLEQRCAFRQAAGYPDGTIYSAEPLPTKSPG